jgi:hypothetical protein
MKIVKENIELSEISLRELNTDCHTVTREDGIIDLVRSHSMVDIFDFYYDRKIKLKRIEVSGGTLNPRLQG